MFEDFLTSFKSSAAATESIATNALQDLHIDDEDLSDDYDFMDDVGGEVRPRRGRGGQDEPKKKYMEMLQQVADRTTSEILIELDDLEDVSYSSMAPVQMAALTMSAKYEKGQTDNDDIPLDLVESIERNTKHYIEIFSRAADKVMPRETKEVS